MRKKICKIKYLVLLMIILIFAGVNANTYYNPDVLMGPNSTKGKELLLDEKNSALESMAEIMTEDDLHDLIYYVSEYRKGEKLVESKVLDIVSKYNPLFSQIIVNYLLKDYNVRLLSSYVVDHKKNEVEYMYIKGLTPVENDDIRKNGKDLWKKITNFLPEEMYKDINCIFIEMNKPEEDTITICELDDMGSMWSLYVDVRLLSEDNKDKLFEQLIYNTVYYYIFRTDQIDFGEKNESNYSYGKHYYKENSYVDMFYKEFWKKRVKELNLGQIETYPTYFINNKASRTVYNDMAVSFYHYVKKDTFEKMSKDVIKKIEFFDKFEIFKLLKQFFRIKGIHSK